MKSVRKVKQLVARARLTADASMDERILGHAGEVLAQSVINRPQEQRGGHGLWRLIMESRTAQVSLAAAILVAVSLVILNPFVGSKGGGVALAEVQKKVAEINTLVLRGHKTFSFAADPNLSLTFDVVKYASTEYGYAEHGYLNDSLAYRLIFNRRVKQSMLVLPLWRKCLIHPFTEEQNELVAKLTPTGVVLLLLETQYKELGPSVINGVAVEGFEVADIKPIENVAPRFLCNIRGGTATVWVGVKDLLPIRVEGDIDIGASLMTAGADLKVREDSNLDSYNVPLDEKLWQIAVPEGYTQIKLTDFLPIKAGIGGVGLCAAAVPASMAVRARHRRRQTRRSTAG